MIMHRKYFWTVLLMAGLLISCKNAANNPEAAPAKPGAGAMAAIISADTTKLSPLLDLKTFRPVMVSFLAGREGDSARQSLEAVLQYEAHDFARIMEKYMDAGFPKAKFNRADFDFEWMEDSLRHELQLSNADYFGSPDIFLGTGGKAGLWFLNKKVLVRLPAR